VSENVTFPAQDAGLAVWGWQPQQRLGELVRGRWLAWSLLIGVTSLALILNIWGLSKAGYGNTYYAAAVRSMTVSWKNFFFGAFDPGGFITVDKPPAFLWVGALSARIFGYSTWSILLPSAVAGAASVALLWLIVRRWAGLTAATIAGLVLALSPVSVAINRLNDPEPFMILALIGAAGSLLQSLESRRWWAWTALAGFLVGVAFNAKMLGAWIPGPAFALALIVAVPAISRTSMRQLLARLAVLGVVTLVVSASWMVVVDAWPASERPYIGGSTDNTVLDLTLGYNGFGRVDGADQVGGGGQPSNPNTGSQGQRPFDGGPGGQGQFPGAGPSAGGPPNVQDGQSGGQPGGGGGPVGGGLRAAGGIIAGVPGLLRMFDSANGGQIGWLLPFALGGGVLALWSWRRDPMRRAFAVLFLGWVILYGAIFSYAQGIYHSYYTSAMAPAVAVLVGMGVVAAVREVRRNPWWLIAPIALVAVTVWAQLQIAGRTPDFYGWLRPLTVLIALAGVGLMAAFAARRLPIGAGLALAIAGLLLLPGAWSVSEAANAPLNTTLPQAGPREGASGQSFGSDAFDDGTAQLAQWLEANSDSDATWQLVVPNAQSGSRLIAEYNISVMALGGFGGRDDTITVDEFAGLVESGDVRYVLVSQGQGGVGGGLPGDGGGTVPGVLGDDGRQAARQSGVAGETTAAGAVLSAVQDACTAVSDTSLPSAYQGTIYDCAGMADAIRQQAN
jgi:4-amino-4-deoxy-L-arabinose transferase-like glycosyltransferase